MGREGARGDRPADSKIGARTIVPGRGEQGPVEHVDADQQVGDVHALARIV
jgi:hypothetical protein